MTLSTPLPWPTGQWRHLLAEAVADVDQLLALLELSRDRLGRHHSTVRATHGFRVRVPRGFIDRMRRGDPHDPLLRQVLPLEAERLETPGFTTDPVGEAQLGSRNGLLRKYRGRALLVATPVCAVHCRYCFRRHFPYGEDSALGPALERALTAISGDPTIREIVLSGGDPLTLSDRAIGDLLRRLEAIPHVRRLRLHTRLPIVLPERVDDGLLRVLAGLQRPPVVVVHANHPAEIDDSVETAINALRSLGIQLFNQSVLLAGVNDSVDILAGLSEVLFESGIVPYYLHQLDPVHGAAHFDVDEETATRLVGELTTRIPGYLVPRLVREIPGIGAKVPLAVRIP